MIYAGMDEIQNYETLNPRFPEAFSALRKRTSGEFVPGRTDVGDGVYINAFSYETEAASGAVMEAHRKYIDVMLIDAGQERIFCAPAGTQAELIEEYSPDGDAFLTKLPEKYTTLLMGKGCMAVFFPGELHAPGNRVSDELPEKTNRYVMKVPVE